MPKGFNRSERHKCEDRAQASEEISTSLCLKEGLNVTAEAMRGNEMHEYVVSYMLRRVDWRFIELLSRIYHCVLQMVDPYHNMLGWNRTEQGEW